jgi:hypothetical protein
MLADGPGGTGTVFNTPAWRWGPTLSDLHLEAMKVFVASLEKRKFAVTDRPRERAAQQPPAMSLHSDPASVAEATETEGWSGTNGTGTGTEAETERGET